MNINPKLDEATFHNKTVSVVGNALFLLNQELGDKIDESDIVIRFNQAWPNKANNYKSTGGRTTHMSLVIRNGYEEMIRRNPNITFFLPRPPPIEWDRVPQTCKKLAAIDHATTTACTEEVKVRWPTSGCSVIWFLLNSTTCKSISVFGMDGLKTGKWYEKKPHWSGHDKLAEQKYLQRAGLDARVTIY